MSSPHTRARAVARRALADTAWVLMIERGVTAVTADAVSAAVRVPVDVFHTYFDSVEEAMIAGTARRWAVVQDRPFPEPVRDSLALLLPRAAGSLGTRDDAGALLERLHADPMLLARHQRMVADRTRSLARAIAARSAAPAELAARALAGAATAAVRVAVRQWAFADAPTALARLLEARLSDALRAADTPALDEASRSPASSATNR